MEPGQRLKDLLQHQLATDFSTIRNIPYAISVLTPDSFAPSSYLTKWVSRINSLIHSKESAARWAGICLAYKTAQFSQDLMVESAQGWLGAVLPLLSRLEPIPTLKATIRLLRVIFTTGFGKPEFQRQVATPNVVKFSVALMSTSDAHTDVELKVLALDTLSQLIANYPTTHRGSHNQIETFTLRHISGSAPTPTNSEIIQAASRLYATLPMTGGKVGSVTVWRKLVDDSLAFGWDGFYSLRTTFPVQPINARQPAVGDDLELWVPLQLDRLRCAIGALKALLSSNTQRPVTVPIGGLVKLCGALVECSDSTPLDGFVNPIVHSMEVAAVPSIHQLGSELLAALAQRFGPHLIPYSYRFCTSLVSIVEQQPSASEKHSTLVGLLAILECGPAHSDIILNRITKALLPIVTKAVSTQRDTVAESTSSAAGTSKRAKKKARNFEGDEVINGTTEAAYSTEDDRKTVLVSLSILQNLFGNPHLSTASQSAIARTVVATLMALPRQSAALISPDARFIYQLSERISAFAVHIGSGTSNVLSKALPFVMSEAVGEQTVEKQLELLLHPRVPPLVRLVPNVEALTLFAPEAPPEEENQKEAVEQSAPAVPLQPAAKPIFSLPTVRRQEPTQPPPAQIEATQTATVAPPSPMHAISPAPPIVATVPPVLPKIAPIPAKISQTVLAPAPISIVAAEEEDEDEDEEMPSINMDSDSGEEDDEEEGMS